MKKMIKSLFILPLFALLVALPSNGQAQWVPIGGPPGWSGPASCFAADRSTIFAAVNGMVYRSSDEGFNWIVSYKGFVQNDVKILAADTADVLAGTQDIVRKVIVAISKR